MPGQRNSTTAPDVPPEGEGWIRGSYTMRASDSTSDGVNGTIVTGSEMREEADVAPGEDVELYVVNDGNDAVTVRSVHNTGNTITIPLELRRELSLSEGDEIEFWIRDHEGNETQTELHGPDSHSQSTDDENDVSYLVTDADPMKYHLVTSQSPDETVCGTSLGEYEFRVDEGDPGDLLDKCLDCVLESNRPVRKDELIQWLAGEVGFDAGEGSSANLSKDQVRQTVEHIRSLRGGDG